MVGFIEKGRKENIYIYNSRVAWAVQPRLDLCQTGLCLYEHRDPLALAEGATIHIILDQQ